MLFIVLIILSSSIFVNATETDIRMVHVVFRHGLRYPKRTELYPKDPYINNFPEKLYTQLTTGGKKSSYALGKYLRQRYSELLNASYNESSVQTLSTATDRTVNTAQLVLLGLFQQSIQDVLKDDFNWHTLPYHIEQEEIDMHLYEGNLHCPAYNRELNNLKNSSEYLDSILKFDNFFQILSNYTGTNITEFHDVNNIYQALLAEESMDLLLPNWAHEIYPNKIHDAAANLYRFGSYTTVLKRLNGGYILKAIIDNCLEFMHSNVQKNETVPQVHLFSGHDRTVASVLSALNVFKAHVPKYNSAVVIELHQRKDNKSYFIKIFYIKNTNFDVEQLILDGCSEECEFQDFVEAINSTTPLNHKYECKANL